MKEPTMTEIEREADNILADVNGNKVEIWKIKGRIIEALTRLSRPPARFVRDDAGVDHPKDQYVIDGWVGLWAAHVRPELMKTMAKVAEEAAAEKERGQ